MGDKNYGYEPVSTGESVPQQSYRMEAGKPYRQFVYAGIASITIACSGFTMGWTSPITIKLSGTDDSPLEHSITSDQISWMGSLLTVGAMFGPFVAGFAASNIGRKWALLSSAVPLLLGFILVTAARSIGLIYAGRVFWGLAAGMAYTLTPIYCAEIATDNSRGALGSFLQLFVTVGFLLVYSVGPFVSYSVVQYVGLVLVVCFTVMFFFAPETPIYHLYKGNVTSAGDCLATIRGKSRAGVQAELDKMAADVKASMDKTATFIDIFRGSNFKAFYICSTLIIVQQLSGINAVLFYMTLIFKTSGANLDSATATIIVGAVQLVASCITPMIIDRLGRRIILMISCCGCAMGHLLLGVYFILDTNMNPIAESIRFVPVLALILYIISFCCGLGPIPWALLGEFLPIEVKAVASPFATTFCWVFCFLVTRYFNPIADAIGMGVAFLIFGVFCFSTFIFTLFVVPETKGKSFQEIQEILAGKSTKENLEKP